VWWGDAHGSTRQLDRADIAKVHRPIIKGSTGWVLKSDDEGVTLWGDFHPKWNETDSEFIDEACDGQTPSFIPAGCIIRTDWWRNAPPPPTK